MAGIPVLDDEQEMILENMCKGVLSDLQRLVEHNEGLNTIEGNLCTQFLFLLSSLFLPG